MTRPQRLRRLNRNELLWRLRALFRIQRDRTLAQLHPPKWDRRRIVRVLGPDVVDTAITAAISRGDWNAVGQRLAAKVSQRPGRFVLDVGERQQLRRAVLARWPEAAEHARSFADRMLEGHFSLLGYDELLFAKPDSTIDWTLDPLHGRRPPQRFWADVPYLDPVVGDHKIIWELNRHQHWLALGRAFWLTDDPRYAAGIVSQLASWLAANPPLTGINWASMLELGFRCISWTWALHFLLGRHRETGVGQEWAWVVDLLIGLDRQLTHAAQNLSHYFSPNTHLTGEALALYVVGRSVPELAGSPHWAEVGRGVLLDEIKRQICADGGHAERSMHYHRYTLDFYLLALLVAHRTGDAAASPLFRDAVARLATFARSLADDQGRLATIGDDDGGMLFPIAGREPADIRDSLAIAAVALARPELAPWGIPEEVLWMVGPTAPFVLDADGTPEPESRCLPDTGYAVIRDGRGGHLIFDAGPHGYLNGGHAHADALAVTLAVSGEPLLIDPGTATYTMEAAVRDRFRRTANHNTVTLDRRGSSEPAGPFHWRSHADARLTTWHANRRMAWAVAAHDAYRPSQHRRSIVKVQDGGWLIVDEIHGGGPHDAELHWHFDPRWRLMCDSETRVRLASGTGAAAWLLHDPCSLSLFKGDHESGFGWCAPVYGPVIPTSTVRFTRVLGPHSAFITWIGLDDGTAAPSMERLDVDSESQVVTIGVRVSTGRRSELTVLRPGDIESHYPAGCSIRECYTDARLLQITQADSKVASLSIADGTRALALIEGLVSVAVDAPVGDLHVEFGGHTVDLVSSTPPAELQLRGDALTAVRLLRLNGRELPAARAGRADTLVVGAADWATPFVELRTACVA